MFIITIVAALLLTVAAVAYVTWPLVQQTSGPVIVEDDRLTELIAHKNATLTAIKELEFDHETGKLSEDDFQRMDAGLRRQAIGYIKAIEKQAPESAMMDERVEAEISALRKTLGVTTQPAVVQHPVAQASEPQSTAAQATALSDDSAPSSDGTSSTVAAATSPASVQPTPEVEPGARYCTNCGHELLPNHKFCGNCGAPVSAE